MIITFLMYKDGTPKKYTYYRKPYIFYSIWLGGEEEVNVRKVNLLSFVQTRISF